MKIKKGLPVLLAAFMVLGSITGYANEVTNQMVYEQQETLKYTPINPMGLPDINPITNPATDNWLTQEIAGQVGKGNVKDLTQNDFNRITSLKMAEKNINTIPEEIGNLYNLTYLDLGNNQIINIHPELGNLSNLG